MNTTPLILSYSSGPALVRQAVEGLSADDFDAVPIPGTWSIRQVVCHLADAEILYADRLKRILAEVEPVLMKAEPKNFLTSLHIDKRAVEDELRLIEAIRAHVTPILRSLEIEQFERTGIHSTDGPMTFRTVLERAVNHIPHHVAFIHEKRQRIADLQG